MFLPCFVLTSYYLFDGLIHLLYLNKIELKNSIVRLENSEVHYVVVASLELTV